MIKKTLLSLCLVFLSVVLFAQGKDIEMGDTMRSNGKIYVVFAVALVILIGIFLYLIRLDRKLSNLEKESKTNQLITK
jgi:CcmD family protein